MTIAKQVYAEIPIEYHVTSPFLYSSFVINKTTTPILIANGTIYMILSLFFHGTHSVTSIKYRNITKTNVSRLNKKHIPDNNETGNL